MDSWPCPTPIGPWSNPRKLADYCLSATHPVGKHKAAVFRVALGLTSADAATLRGWLLRAAIEADAVAGQSDEFGDRYTVDFEASGPFGPAEIRSAWIILTGEEFPRLTTCWVF